MTNPGTPRPKAIFVGLNTLDVIQLVDHVPAENEKITALAQTVAAGGPATNAAATFAFLGGHATLVTGVGTHPLAAGVRADLASLGVTLVDLVPEHTAAPTLSSIYVTQSSGARSVVSTNGTSLDLAAADLGELLADADAVQVDGHHPRVARAALEAARQHGRPTVIDAGSWKPSMPQLLPLLDVVVCSADFHPPGTTTPHEAATYLADHGIGWVAITQGAGPILRWHDGALVAQPVPTGPVVDTLGAGDIFHGALTFGIAGHWPLTDATFTAVLDRAAAVATRSCASFGTRAWMSTQHQ